MGDAGFRAAVEALGGHEPRRWGSGCAGRAGYPSCGGAAVSAGSRAPP